MSVLREELISYINFISEDKLPAIKPLLYMLSNESMILEKLSDNDMTNEEKEAFHIGKVAYDSGVCVDLEEYLKERRTE